MRAPTYTIILEEASLELVPSNLRFNKGTALVQSRFGIKPEFQILDSNYHHEIISKMKNREKRGRPDLVHFALLDITSTPLYSTDGVQVCIHTVEGHTIRLKRGVRPPRTLNRFCGVMSKLLASSMGKEEKELFDFEEGKDFGELVHSLGNPEIIAFTSRGTQTNLREFIPRIISDSSGSIAFVVGGFPNGHFKEEVIEGAREVVSISKRPLPAHVVTARICYELEQATNVE